MRKFLTAFAVLLTVLFGGLLLSPHPAGAEPQ